MTPRRRLLVYPQFQVRFLAHSTLIALVAIAMFYGAKIMFFREVENYIQGLGFPPNHTLFTFLAQQSSQMDLIFGAASVLAILAVSLGNLLLSHRVAGPLVRLMDHFEKVSRGAPREEIHFRTKDFFQELAQAYNAAFRNTK